MSMIVERPVKRAGTRRYTDELAAGQPFIWEDEVDADLDTIYAAVSTTPAGLADGEVTTPKLANGAATMAKLGLSRTRVRQSATVDARTPTPATLSLAFTPSGGLCFLTGTLQVEFDGTPSKAAVAEIEVRSDGVSLATDQTPFTATGTTFVVPIPLFEAFRPTAAPHTLELLVRSTGDPGTSVTVLQSVLSIRELE